MFVDATPNGELAAECKKTLTSSELKVRVVERSGQSLRSVLSKSDLFQNGCCGKDTCKVCKASPKINCKTRDIVYTMIVYTKDEMPRLYRKRPKKRNIYWRNSKKHRRESK